MIKPHSKKVELETKSKVISWLKVYAPIIAIFSISLAANIVLFNWRDAPVYFSQDSQS
jgi:hypothetical protein